MSSQPVGKASERPHARLEALSDGVTTADPPNYSLSSCDLLGISALERAPDRTRRSWVASHDHRPRAPANAAVVLGCNAVLILTRR